MIEICKNTQTTYHFTTRWLYHSVFHTQQRLNYRMLIEHTMDQRPVYERQSSVRLPVMHFTTVWYILLTQLFHTGRLPEITSHIWERVVMLHSPS